MAAQSKQARDIEARKGPRPLRNLDARGRAFNVTPGQKLCLPPEPRLRIRQGGRRP